MSSHAVADIRIDSHQHFWSTARTDYGWLTADVPDLYRDFLPDDLAPILQATGIRKTVLIQAAPTVEETRYLLDLAHGAPFVAAVVGWVDLLAPDAPDTIASFAGSVLRGIRPMLQDIADINWIDDARLRPALDALIAHHMTFDALVRPAHLPALRRMMARHPRLRVVIDHGAKPDIAGSEIAQWAREMRLVARESPACCKMSGLVTEAAPGVTFETLRPYLDVLFEEFGPERLMWGSDWPVVNLACDYEAWWRLTQQYLAPLDSAAHAAVLGATAAHFYGLAS